MVTLRLDNHLTADIDRAAGSMGVSRSVFIRNSILDYLKHIQHPGAYELGADLFGRHALERTDTSVNRKTILRERIAAKHHRKRS